MKLDTDIPGRRALLKEYEWGILAKLWELKAAGTKRNPFKGWASSQMHTWLKEGGYEGSQKYNLRSGQGPVSRSSVIQALNRFVDQGFMDYTEQTGKGGRHKVYRMIVDPPEFQQQVTDTFQKKLEEDVFSSGWSWLPLAVEVDV